MNKWIEVVMAWFVGGLIGRVLGHTYLVGYLGWPEISGWLSVPIGAVVAWLWVAKEAILPALKHAYRWTEGRPKAIAYCVSEITKICLDDKKEFKSNWPWRILRAVSCGLLWGLWINTIFFVFCLPSEMITILIVVCFMIGGILCVAMFFEYMDWKHKTYDRWDPNNEEKNDALKWMFIFLIFNPVSPILICLLIVGPYWVIKGLVQTGVWFGKVLWKTIKTINSSQRMAAMTGAVVGLSISQIYGHNPLICGGVCVLAGLVERTVFILTEKFILGLMVKQVA